MAKVRELFHTVGNCHNKISVGAGVAKAELKNSYPSTLPIAVEQALQKLSKIEQEAVEASKILNQLKDLIYKMIDPDTDVPLRNCGKTRIGRGTT